MLAPTNFRATITRNNRAFSARAGWINTTNLGVAGADADRLQQAN
jgi:hypothetical protein